MRLYFAAPLFTTAERDFNATVVAGLRKMGHEVFLPQEQEQRGGYPSQDIFQGDVRWYRLGRCCCRQYGWRRTRTVERVGRRGYAYNKKPVILYRTDIREEKPPLGPYNLMMHQAATRVLDCKWMTCSAIVFQIDGAILDVFGSRGPKPMTEAERVAWANDMRDGM